MRITTIATLRERLDRAEAQISTVEGRLAACTRERDAARNTAVPAPVAATAVKGHPELVGMLDKATRERNNFELLLQHRSVLAQAG